MDQILQLEPKNELRFRGPFQEVVTALLKLTNPSNERVCFKVKTTAPKKYCVRPNCGVIEPHRSTNVHVMLQPFEYDPQERNKHKFMVQSVFAPEGEINHDVFWKEAPKEMIMDSKLRCVFDMPGVEDEGPHAHGDEAEKEVFSPTVQHEAAPHGDSNPREEIKRLQNEVFQLRKENSTLREDGLRHRTKNPQPTETETSYNPPQSSSGPLSQVSHNTLLIYALMLIICGFILGKFIF
ncbi:vesicle-associated membrane protein/synaptobrevin-binding protein [Galendromus occidentalis]|uniref:Vesicle-associated membrane protein/synaptobrevin-binding protein n=1 Tax=Galendromus occidentalis TaxID=34638 RepID=A0AAJ6QUL0_9ACAR|nr:vesicle-associated membrane protein/synaptobrevin-binding protein [Galendromus occidentalis]